MIDLPNYTPVPNVIIRQLMKELTGLELKIVLAILTQTIGWHKQTDVISLTQLEELTGSQRNKILVAVEKLIEKNIIIKNVFGPAGAQKTSYEIKFSNISEKFQTGTGGGSKEEPETSSQKEPTKEIAKEKPKESKQCAQAREAALPAAEKITYQGHGKEETITKSDVYKHFLDGPYTTEQINEAISRLSKRTGAIGDPFKVLGFILADMQQPNKFAPPKKHSYQPIKNKASFCPIALKQGKLKMIRVE